MIHHSLRLRAATAAVLLASMAAACGKTDAPASPAATAAPTAVPAAAAAPGDAIATIRKNLVARLPELPRIEEISPTPVAGLYEVRLEGAEIVYSDAEGKHVIQGQLIDTQLKRNLTEERIDKLTAVAFKDLPLKDAFTIVRGKGERKLAVFEDPNCGYCKRFERDLQGIDNVTVHLFLYPILGPDSTVKSTNIWCAKDKALAWTNWMLRSAAPASATCDTAAVERNVAFGKKHKITGTPTLIFSDGTRVPGALPGAEVEQLLAAAARKS